MAPDIDFLCAILTTLINKHDKGGSSRDAVVISVYLETNAKSPARISDAIDELVEKTDFIDASDERVTLVVTNFTYFTLENTLKEDCNWTEDDIQSLLNPIFSDSYHKPL